MVQDKQSKDLVRTFWLITKAQKKQVEKIAKKYGISESNIIRGFIAKIAPDMLKK